MAYQIVFSQSLNPLQGLVLREESLYDGTLVHVIMHFPLNCAGLVDIRFGVEGNQVYPSSDFIALDDSTPKFDDTPRKIRKGQKLWAEMANHDSVSSHRPSVIATIAEE